MASFLPTSDDLAPADLPDGLDADFNIGAKIEEFLVKYVVRRRNPLSATASILRAVQEEMDRFEENRRSMRLTYTRFHSLHLALLRRLNRYADVRNVRQVERILQPSDLPNTVNEVSPLQVAFDSMDLKFMTETLIEVYIKVQWSGAELLALTNHEDLRATGAINPLLAYAVLRNLGFAGKGTLDPLVMAAARVWHTYAFTSVAFFNSPRGRWAMHAMCELAFLILYQWQVMYPRTEVRSLLVLHFVFLAFILGNLLDMVQFVHYRYGSMARIRKYLTDPWNALGLLVNGCLLVLTTLKLAQDFKSPGLHPYETADALHMCMATLAVFVWVRALGMAVPVYPTLGPLLNTVARMMEEVIAFLFPMVIIMTGFSTMMSAVYQETVPDFNNFASAMLTLFTYMLGNFDFTIFDGLPTPQRLYGIIVTVIFLIISAILLMNLLVAIITNRYRPEEVEAETQFKKAQIVNFYQTQVTRNLVCSPFCLPHVALCALGLPSGRRPKVSGSSKWPTKLGLLPLDGVVLPDDGSDRPTGLGELPHLVFLLTLYPVMIVVTWLMFLLYTPFGVWQFASKQYARITKEYGRAHGGRAQQHGSAFAAAVIGGKAAAAAAINAAAGKKKKKEAKGTPKKKAEDISNANRRKSIEGAMAHAKSGLDNAEHYQKFKKALQAEAQQAEMGLFKTGGYVVGTSLLMVAGLLYYVLIMLLLVLAGWSGLYQWGAKVVFSMYNVVLRPIHDLIRARRRRRRVAPSPSFAGRGGGGGGSGSGRSSSGHLALAVGATATANGINGIHGPNGVDEITDGALRGAPTQQQQQQPDGTRRGLSTYQVERSGGGASDNGVPGRAATSPSRAIAGLFATMGRRDANAAALLAHAEAEKELQTKRRAQVHWRHAIQRVIALKNERYLPHRDVMKALAASKFKPHMAVWNMAVDPRSTSQDILDAQMQDLEDDDDGWDDDELAGDADNDAIEELVLERTDALTEIVKSGMHVQTATLVALAGRVQDLVAEVARLSNGGANGHHNGHNAHNGSNGNGNGFNSTGGGYGNGFNHGGGGGGGLGAQVLSVDSGTADTLMAVAAAAAAGVTHGTSAAAVSAPVSALKGRAKLPPPSPLQHPDAHHLHQHAGAEAEGAVWHSSAGGHAGGAGEHGGEGDRPSPSSLPKASQPSASNSGRAATPHRAPSKDGPSAAAAAGSSVPPSRPSLDGRGGGSGGGGAAPPPRTSSSGGGGGAAAAAARGSSARKPPLAPLAVLLPESPNVTPTKHVPPGHGATAPPAPPPGHLPPQWNNEGVMPGGSGGGGTRHARPATAAVTGAALTGGLDGTSDGGAASRRAASATKASRSAAQQQQAGAGHHTSRDERKQHPASAHGHDRPHHMAFADGAVEAAAAAGGRDGDEGGRGRASPRHANGPGYQGQQGHDGSGGSLPPPPSLSLEDQPLKALAAEGSKGPDGGAAGGGPLPRAEGSAVSLGGAAAAMAMAAPRMPSKPLMPRVTAHEQEVQERREKREQQEVEEDLEEENR